MKTLNSDSLDFIETFAEPKGSWIVLESRFGKFQEIERLSYYEFADKYFCIIDRAGYSSKSIVHQYRDKEEVNLHFLKIKLFVNSMNFVIRKDKKAL